MLFWHAMTEISDADNAFMQAALEEARAAATRGEVPVGAVIVAENHSSHAGATARCSIATHRRTPKS